MQRKQRRLAILLGAWLSSPLCLPGLSGLPSGATSAWASEPSAQPFQTAAASQDETADSKGADEKKNSGPLKVGDKAVDFKLEGIDGPVQLSKVLDEKKNVILVFSRAYW